MTDMGRNRARSVDDDRADNPCVASVDGECIGCSLASARLIAAAPELLEALRLLVTLAECNPAPADPATLWAYFVARAAECRAALRKATEG